MLERRSGQKYACSEGQLTDLWAELAAFPVHESEQAMDLFLNRLCQMLGAYSGSWLAMKKLKANPRRIKPEDYRVMQDELGGWAPVAAIYTKKQRNLKSVMARWLMLARNEGVDPLTEACIAGQGHTRVCLRREVTTDEAWEKSWMAQKFLANYGIGDRILAMFHLSADSESCIVIDRKLGDHAFTEAEKNTLHLAISGAAVLHRRIFLEHGALGASAPLSRRERETYRHLLTDMSESQIAEKMELSIHTVHDYARGLYKKFGVKGRVGLMALALDPS